MKLRITGNSLRLRLTRSEVQSFGKSGKIEDQVCFPGNAGTVLRYSLERSGEDSLNASFADGNIRIFIPKALAATWVMNGQIGVESGVELVGGNQLKILVEKDFAFLRPKNEDDSDKYPHPLKSKAASP